jgi:quinoprotein glucose dehydrogenase
LLAFLFKEEIGGEIEEPGLGQKENMQISYQINLFKKFLDNKGYPAIAPPWGTLNAIDLNTGDYLWKITYG